MSHGPLHRCNGGTGGQRTGNGWGYRPTVLDHCTDDMDVVSEETFGPVLAVVRVSQAVDAIRAVNGVNYGLNGSVWTTNLQLGEAIARQLEVGIALVNNHSFTGVIPQIPWTGVKGTGTGVLQAPGISLLVRRRTVVVDKSKTEVLVFANADLLVGTCRCRSFGGCAKKLSRCFTKVYGPSGSNFG